MADNSTNEELGRLRRAMEKGFGNLAEKIGWVEEQMAPKAALESLA